MVNRRFKLLSRDDLKLTLGTRGNYKSIKVRLQKIILEMPCNGRAQNCWFSDDPSNAAKNNSLVFCAKQFQVLNLYPSAEEDDMNKPIIPLTLLDY